VGTTIINMLNETDGVCVDIALTLCKNGTNEDHSTHSSLLIGLRLSEPDDYFFFLRLDGLSVDYY
jgi:hypothetical protein